MTRLEAKVLVASGELMAMALERGERSSKGVEYDLCRGLGRLCRCLPSALQLVYLVERGRFRLGRGVRAGYPSFDCAGRDPIAIKQGG